jgi:hypothetical protein
MIENEELGLKVAENEQEAILNETIKSFEKRIPQSELALEIDRVVLDHLQGKRAIMGLREKEADECSKS